MVLSDPSLLPKVYKKCGLFLGIFMAKIVRKHTVPL